MQRTVPSTRAQRSGLPVAAAYLEARDRFVDLRLEPRSGSVSGGRLAGSRVPILAETCARRPGAALDAGRSRAELFDAARIDGRVDGRRPTGHTTADGLGADLLVEKAQRPGRWAHDA